MMPLVDVFVIGVTGQVGRLITAALTGRGDAVRGLVRTEAQRAELAGLGVGAVLGDLIAMSPNELAAACSGADAVVYTAGSNAGPKEITDTVDLDGVVTALDAARRAGVRRFLLVSVMPEAWRERALSDDEEHYFAVKKRADVVVTRSGLDWVIVRPSLLTDEPGAGTVSLGPAEIHEQIARADVAATVVEVLHELRTGRQILEVTAGEVPIAEAVRRNVPSTTRR